LCRFIPRDKVVLGVFHVLFSPSSARYGSWAPGLRRSPVLLVRELGPPDAMSPSATP
jgi:hypothetical protein